MIQRFTKQQEMMKNEITASKKVVSKNFDTHWHEYYEIEIILSGSGTYTVDGIEYPIKRGMMFFMSPFNFHSVNTTGCDIYNIMFMGEMCNKELLCCVSLSKTGTAIMLDNKQLEVISTYAGELVDAVKNQNDQYMLQLLNTILAKISILSHAGKQKEFSKLQKAILFIHQNFRQVITLDDVAKTLNVTPSYMSRMFSENMGITFKQYLNEIRYGYAMRLLMHSDMSATEVCYESGFNDYSNFSRSFKDKFGVSPGHFRSNR